MGNVSKGARALALCLCVAAPVAAQDTGAPWPIFVQENPMRCWLVSQPSGTTASRDGQDVSGAISRDVAVLSVSFWPDDGRLAEVSYTGGYQFEVGSSVSVVVDDATFALFTEGPLSWAGSPQDDQRIVAAMRDGSQAVVTATSTRGTQVVDTFSLQGFSEAMDDATVRCTPST